MCIEELRSRRLPWKLRWWTGDEGEGGSARLQVGSAQLRRTEWDEEAARRVLDRGCDGCDGCQAYRASELGVKEGATGETNVDNGRLRLCCAVGACDPGRR
jgi:hypothetical protein